MAFARPTLTELRLQVADDVNAALPGVDALLRFSNLRILSDALAAAVYGHYGYLDWISQQSVPFTATGEYLEGWAALKNVTREPPTSAQGTVTFTGTDGTVIPTDTPLNRSDGEPYFTTGAGTIASGTVTVPVQALNTGGTGNADVGTSMILATGISGATPVGTVATTLTGGADVETDDSLRTRMMTAFANPPQGGSFNDYVGWALGVPGVTRVWLFPSGHGAGTMDIYFMMDVAEAAHGGFPQGSNGVAALETRDTAATGDQLALANALYLVQPAHVIVYALAPSPNTVSMTITGLSGASADTKAAVEAAISSALQFGAIPGGTANISEVEYEITLVAGTAGFVITLVTCTAGSVVGSAGNITSNAGCIPVLGTVTFA